jgi:hypothetical protein
MILVREEKKRPPGDLIITVKANIGGRFVMEQLVAVGENDDPIEVLRKAGFNPKISKLGYSPPWRELQKVWLNTDHEVKNWGTAKMPTWAHKESWKDRHRREELKLLYAIRDKRAQEEKERWEALDAEEKKRIKQAEIDAWIAERRAKAEI